MAHWQFYINFFGRLFLSFYFLKAGVNNAINWKKVASLVQSKNIPLATLVVAVVVFLEIVGSLAVIFNFYTEFAAFSLILFTFTVNLLFCNYWTMEGVQRKTTSFIFYANFAVIGALLLIISMQY